MDTSISYSGYVDISLDTDEEFESYGYAETSHALERIYNDIESYKAGFQDREYIYDQ